MTTRSFTEEQFDAAVAELTAAGLRPTVRKLRQRLGSGSHETLAPLLAQWRDARAPDSAPTTSPAAIQARANELAAEVWAVAQQQAAAELDAVRQRLEATQRTLVEELADARLDIAELESTCADLRRSLAAEGAAREAETRLRIEAVERAERLTQLDTVNAELRSRVSRDIVSCRLHAILGMLMKGRSPLLLHDADAALMQLLQDNLVVLPCADFSRPTLINREGRPTTHYSRLRELCDGASLVLLDPLRQLHSGDEVDSAYMTDVMSLLQQIVAGTQGALLVAHHTSQASSVADYGERAQAARGSTAITDAVRYQLNLSTPSTKWLLENDVHLDEPARLIRVDIAKSNHLPPVPTQLLLRGAGGVLRQPRQHELLSRMGSGARASRRGAR